MKSRLVGSSTKFSVGSGRTRSRRLGIGRSGGRHVEEGSDDPDRAGSRVAATPGGRPTAPGVRGAASPGQGSVEFDEPEAAAAGMAGELGGSPEVKPILSVFPERMRAIRSEIESLTLDVLPVGAGRAR